MSARRSSKLKPIVNQRDPNTDNPEIAVVYGRRKTDNVKRRKAQFFVTFCHWAMVALLVVNILTGARLGWAYMNSPLGGAEGTWASILDSIAPEGLMLEWHVWSSWALAGVVGLYVIYLLKTKESRRLRLQKSDFAAVWGSLKRRDFLRNKFALWSANVIVYWLAFVFLAITFITGIAMYQLEWGVDQKLGGYGTQRLLHGIFAYAFIPYMIVHALLEWMFGTFWSIFKATFYAKRLKAGVLGLVVATSLFGGLFLFNGRPRELVAERITAAEAPVLDGNPSDPAWAKAGSISVTTVKGVNLDDGHVDIHVKALHDAERVYFRLQWKDPNVSGMRYPLKKTEGGWKVLGSGFEGNDEVTYYEDKLSMYITDVPNGSCSATCHLGQDPMDVGRKATWGLHYTTEGETGDIWHWKYVRTNSMNSDKPGVPGHADDMYFGPPQAPKEGKRYTGGYFDDPQPGGGYKYVHDKTNKDAKLADQFVKLKYLPKVLTTATDNDPMAHHTGKWWLLKDEVIPYSEEADKAIPVGTHIPNIYVEPFQGDRAHVLAKAVWNDGVWTLELSRALDTGSKYDVAFKAERPVYITIAVYQNVQTRHSEQLKPFRFVLR